MNGKENIINKILADAENKCAEILSAAERQAQEIADNAKAFSEKERLAAEKRLEALRVERQRNSMASAMLEARKYKLAQKQQLISLCYQKAEEALTKLSAAQKKDLIVSLLKRYAEKGETVVPAKADKEIVTQKLLDGLGLGLTLSKHCHDQAGGIVLEGAGYDKDLTLKKIVAFAREQTEASVANTLFGE